VSAQDDASDAPRLTTDRLELRAHRLDDFEACTELWTDPIVTRHIGRQPQSAETVWSRILRYAGHWSLLGFGYWVVEERSSGRFVGEIGFADFKRDITPSLEGLPEVGWVLAPWAHGVGFATEAVRAALAWGDQRFTQTVCLISPENTASIRVGEKCGYRESERTMYKGEPTIVYRRSGRSPGRIRPES
jgi:RimJ/RimL family protein N-acetyltransferase